MEDYKSDLLILEKNMTYKELAMEIAKFNKEQLLQDVTVFNTFDQEYFPVRYIETEEETDVLNKGHPYLAF